MSSGPPGNPFDGLPFFGDLAKLLGQGGGVPWDAARSLALAVATEGQSEPNVEPVERIKLEQLARVAELHVANVSGLSTTVGGRELSIMPVNRALWATKTLDAFRPLLEKLATALGTPAAGDEGDDEDELSRQELAELGLSDDDPMSAVIGPMLQAMQPTMVAMTAGSMVGHLARRSFGQYDLPIPRPLTGELMIVVPNLDAFGEEWSLPPDDLKLWICIHEIAHHAVLGVPHVRARLDDLIGRFATGFRNDPHAFEDHLRDLETSDESDLLGQLQQVLGEPGALLGAIQSDAQRALKPQLEATVAVVAGVVDHVMDQVGAKLIGSYGMLTEALRRRRVETSEADRFVERLIGLELTQATYDRGAAFVDGVVERAGEEGLSRLWEGERMLPSPPEVDAPGLWLARIDLPVDDD
ncbi:MAG TPA: zinc-dependent metalloprotease [Acidimicrobiales bacterium]|nr:zinc-dependent metalloprotease [Acidimicrobiales bacterium]